jgi:hypothetical protein
LIRSPALRYESPPTPLLSKSMTEAIIGLVGVLVGGLVSGGATYIMTRRAERARLRAAARLVENELEHVRTLVLADLGNLDILRTIETEFGFDDTEDTTKEDAENLAPPNLLAVSTEVWREHQGTLAQGLDGRKWYRLQRAYVAIESRQQEQEASRRSTTPHVVWSSEPGPTWEQDFRLLLTWIDEGMLALAELSGRDRAPWVQEGERASDEGSESSAAE